MKREHRLSIYYRVWKGFVFALLLLLSACSLSAQTEETATVAPPQPTQVQPQVSPTNTPPPTHTPPPSATPTATPSPTATPTATPAFPQSLSLGYGAQAYTCGLVPVGEDGRVLRLRGDCVGPEGNLTVPHSAYVGSPLNYRISLPPGYEVVAGPGVWVDGQGRVFVLCGAPVHTQPGRQVCAFEVQGEGRVYRVEIPVEIEVGPTATPEKDEPKPTEGPPPDPFGTPQNDV